MKLRVLKPSVGAPKKVAALVSAAMIDANTAHQGIDRPPRANSLRVRLRRPAQRPIPTIPKNRGRGRPNRSTARQDRAGNLACRSNGYEEWREVRMLFVKGSGVRFLTR